MSEEYYESKYRVPLFDGNNFGNWKFRMQGLLDELDLLDLIAGEYTEKVKFQSSDGEKERAEKDKLLKILAKRDKKCRSRIIERIADSHLEYVKDFNSAFRMWKNLCDTFERKSIASQLLLRKQLLKLKFNPVKGTMSEHFLEFDKLVRDLRSSGAIVEETDAVCHLLLTMSQEYDSVVTALETLSAENLKLSFVKNRLMDHESKYASSKKKPAVDSGQNTVFNTYRKNFSTRKTNWKNKSGDVGISDKHSSGGEKQYNFRCHNCGEFGHKRADCNKRLKDKKGCANSVNCDAQDFSVNSDAYCFSIGAFSESVSWYLDSGASEHFVNDLKHVDKVHILEREVVVNVAKSGSVLKATQFGEMNVISYINGKAVPILIKKIFYLFLD